MRTDLEVLQNLRARQEGGARNRKIGLLLPGGGMGGAFSGGVVCALDEAGFSACFDTIYAYSSGAPVGAYFLTNDTTNGSTIYKEDFTGFKFFQPWRPYRWMNMDHFEYTLRITRPLNTDMIQRSSTELKIQVTDVKDGSTTTYSNRDSVDIVKLICASCAMPGFTPPIEINGKLYCDGGVTDFMDIDYMIRDNCTDILAVVNFPVGYKRPVLDIPHKVSMLQLKGYSSSFRKRYEYMTENYNSYIDRLFSDYDQCDANICIISPDQYMSPMTTRKSKLKLYDQIGRSKLRSLLEAIPVMNPE